MASRGDRAQPVVPAAAAMPADAPALALRYESREGSVPPPHYFEYSIVVAPGGAAEVVFKPDYDHNDPPIWRETLKLGRARLAALEQLIAGSGVLEAADCAPTAPVVGGRTRRAELTLGGRRVEVRGDCGDPEAAARVFEAIEGLVDGSVWSRLKERRRAYQESYQKRHKR